MTDAPDRIWIDPGAQEVVQSKVDPDYDAEYLRRDSAVLARDPMVLSLIGAVIDHGAGDLVGTIEGPMTPFQRLVLARELDNPFDRDDVLEALDLVETAIHRLYADGAAIAAFDRAKQAARDAALEILAEEATSDEIPGGYLPPESPDWHRGYDAAIRKARAITTPTTGGKHGKE